MYSLTDKKTIEYLCNKYDFKFKHGLGQNFLKSEEVLLDIVEAAECKNVEYLYVTTFQNDNYRFFADVVDFDIHKKCRELDAYAI